MDRTPRPVTIAGQPVGPGHRPLILAEIGINHNGDPQLGGAMIRAAREAGADAVKFQAFTPCRLFNPVANPVAVEMFQEWALTETEFLALHQIATAEAIPFLCTPFGVDWVAFLDDVLQVPAFKVASSDCTNPLLLDAVAATGKPVILSTGMARLEEVAYGVGRLEAGGCPGIVLLHCITQYPPEAGEVNLLALRTLAAEFPWPIGFSDHWTGNLAAFGALAMGACLIEKHFTLDRELPGPDQAGSADPAMLRDLVEAAPLLWQMRGDGVKEAKGRETGLRIAGRPGLYLSQSLPAGHRLRREDLYAARPQGEVPADALDAVLGQPLPVDLAADDAVPATLLVSAAVPVLQS